MGGDGPIQSLALQPGIPPELKAILPADAVAKLEAIHTDQSSFQEKQEKIDKVMR